MLRRASAISSCALVLILSASCSSPDRGDGDSSESPSGGSFGSLGSADDMSSSETDADGPGCSQDPMAAVVSFCEAQFPPDPGPGEPGGICNNDTDCQSEFCYQNPSGPRFCSALCTSDDDCPYGFECGDSGTGLGLICLEKGPPSCGYIASTPGECVTTLLDQLDSYCDAGCEALAAEWLGCIDSIAPICWSTEVQDACGIELGLLEDCCACTIS